MGTGFHKKIYIDKNKESMKTKTKKRVNRRFRKTRRRIRGRGNGPGPGPGPDFVVGKLYNFSNTGILHQTGEPNPLYTSSGTVWTAQYVKTNQLRDHPNILEHTFTDTAGIEMEFLEDSGAKGVYWDDAMDDIWKITAVP
jgi:hypothetical protein